MPTFLHVGCGAKRKDQATRGFAMPEWQELRLDIDPSVAPDVVGTMTDMAAIASESVDAIFSSHNLEHLEAHEGFTHVASMRRGYAPFFDLWALATKGPIEEKQLRELVSVHFPLDASTSRGLPFVRR